MNNTPFGFKDFAWHNIVLPVQENEISSLEDVGATFKLDQHHIKDIMEKGHLPKFEKLAEYDFIILRVCCFNENNHRKIAEKKYDDDPRNETIRKLTNKIAFFLIKDPDKEKVITIHLKEVHFLDELKNEKFTKVEFITKAILKIVNSYEFHTTYLSDEIDKIEKQIFESDKSLKEISLQTLYEIKRDARFTKNLLKITEEVIKAQDIIKKSNAEFQNINDKLKYFILAYTEVIEDATNLLTTYMSQHANNTNDKMLGLTNLTIFAVTTTFFTGLYGMNFLKLPFKEKANLYPFVAVIILICLFSAIIWIFISKISNSKRNFKKRDKSNSNCC